MPPQEVRRQFKIGAKAARRVLEEAISKVVDFDGVTVTLLKGLTTTEQELLQACGQFIRIKPVYDDEQLIEQFADALAKNKIIGEDEIAALRAQKEFVAVVAMEKMHLTTISVGGGKTALLRLSSIDGFLCVSASMDLEVGAETPIKTSYTIFSSSCRPEHWVEGRLSGDNPVNGWACPLEINQAGRFQSLLPLAPRRDAHEAARERPIIHFQEDRD